MITGPQYWAQALASERKWALYYIYFPEYGIYITSFIPILANVPIM